MIRRIDWRGWLSLAWVLFWGSAYVMTVIEARGPQLAEWFHRLFAAR